MMEIDEEKCFICTGPWNKVSLTIAMEIHYESFSTSKVKRSKFVPVLK
jgi:hypothetical protein